MSELAEKSMRVLELPAVLALLADQAASDAAKARCRALLPQTEAEDVVRLQEETDAARAISSPRAAARQLWPPNLKAWTASRVRSS